MSSPSINDADNGGWKKQQPSQRLQTSKLPSKITRRRWMSLSAMAATGLAVGCPSPTATTSTEQDDSTSTNTVPLRLLMMGDAETAENLRRGWASVSAQELEITRIDRSSRETAIDVDTVIESAGSSDILWVPRLLLADLVHAKKMDPLRGEAVEATLKPMYPTLRTGISQFAGKTYALPLGPAVASILSTEPIDAPNTWAQYDGLVEDQWSGMASEPTAPGWAGMMFLWRCTSSVKRWLFDQKTLEPLIRNAQYVAVLKQMATTHAKYQQTGLTPDQIYQQLCDGKLRGAIGFPTSPDTDASAITSVHGLPSGASQPELGRRKGRHVFDVMSPVVGIASSCRQTKASKTFLSWIVGGPSSENTRSSLPSVFPNSASKDSSDQSADQRLYMPVRGEILSDPLSLPGLTLLRAGEYYGALDQAIRDCLAGKTSAADSLENAATKWSKLTQEIGPENQTKVWLQNIGIRT